MLDEEPAPRATASDAEAGGVSAADRLDVLRKRGGLMARDIAAMLDASVQTISRWQTGKGEPHRKLSARLFVLEQLIDELAAFYPPHRIHDWLFASHRLLAAASRPPIASLSAAAMKSSSSSRGLRDGAFG